jgi:FlaA1/EpsC-like NDP-sugar epimerase
LRPGEKLREELSHDFEQAGKTPHPKIRVLANHSPVRAGVGLRQSREIISRLTKISDRSRPDFVREAIMSLVAEIDGGADVAERPIPIPIPAANYAYIAGKAGD